MGHLGVRPAMDHQVDRLVVLLRESRLQDTTHFVYNSDHGD